MSLFDNPLLLLVVLFDDIVDIVDPVAGGAGLSTGDQAHCHIVIPGSKPGLVSDSPPP